jgi:signal transduction histidine kinase
MVALEESLQEVTRMSDLVDSLLTLARADEGRFELVYEEIRVEPLLRDVYETATILGETSGLSISMPSVADAMILGERIRLRQLLLNLITNAIKYTPRGGKVEIASVLKSPTEVAITVRDTGIGISATDLPHIFDRFWRADRARSRAVERSGFGLGLAISQYIAQAHGGTLVAQSRLGRGTLFTLSLPVASQPQPAPRDAIAASSNSDFTDS